MYVNFHVFLSVQKPILFQLAVNFHQIIGDLGPKWSRNTTLWFSLMQISFLDL